jgi:hypothetical protein
MMSSQTCSTYISSQWSRPEFGVQSRRFLIKGETIYRIYRNRDFFGDVRFTIRGGRLRYKRYDAHFPKK